MATQHDLTKLLEDREIDSLRQRGDTLDIDFTDGSTLEIKLASEQGSIKLTDDDDNVEYQN